MGATYPRPAVGDHVLVRGRSRIRPMAGHFRLGSPEVGDKSLRTTAKRNSLFW